MVKLTGNPMVKPMVKMDAKNQATLHSPAGLLSEHAPSENGRHAIPRLLLEHSPALLDALERHGADQKTLLPTLLCTAQKAGIHLEARNLQGDTLLLQAARQGNYPNAVKKLLNGGADAQATDQDGLMPLAVAIQSGNRKNIPPLVEKAWADDCLSQGDFPYNQLLPPEALRKRTMERLNATDAAGQTPLMLATLNGDRYAVLALLNKGAAVTRQDTQGKTPLHMACAAGNPYIGNLVLKAGPHATGKQDDKGMTPLMHWVRNFPLRSKLDYATDLHYFLARLWWTKELQFPVADAFGFHLVANCSEETLNLQDQNGKTALFHLLEAPQIDSLPGHLMLCVLMTQHNALRYLADHSGKTPIEAIIDNPVLETRTLAALLLPTLWSDVDWNAQDEQTGKTLLLRALCNGHLFQSIMLLSNAALNINLQDKHGASAAMQLATLPSSSKYQLNSPQLYWLKALRFFSKTLREKSWGDDPSLHAAVAHFMMQKGANLKLKNLQGQTALMIAVQNQNLPVVKVFAREAGTLEQEDFKGQTALMYAILNQNTQEIKALCLAGAKLHQPNQNGQTAWDLALQEDNAQVLKCLKSFNATPV